ncbi:hypothetical protein RND71_039828 [Anisodus tanguticus]|uniref:GDSL esterase/lipase n=1 Tax=Anisodus tanguticus TaxID=243964 RepID=A0AAE1R0B5_9SOLA|nr:hypothetical protein RND71_039828 [Anisodus tanguticus]
MVKLRFSCFCLMFFLLTSSVLVEGDYAYDYDDAFAPGDSEAPSPEPSLAPAPAPAPSSGGRGQSTRALVPALFAFGDSLIDNGNNNKLFSFAKANYFPYGIDLGGPTGRFSNGYTIIDQIADLLGLPLLPPHSESSNVNKMRYGVNYASAAAGILDITGFHFKFYNLGARKVIIAGIGQMGCIPSMLAESSSGQCSDLVNEMVHPFNAKLKTMVMKLNKALPGAHFIYLDMENMFMDIISNHKSYGFNVIDRGCCGIGRHRGEVTCLPMQTPCPNRDEYLFWDAYHPTSAVNLLLGSMAFYGGSNFTYPMNIEQLAGL